MWLKITEASSYLSYKRSSYGLVIQSKIKLLILMKSWWILIMENFSCNGNDKLRTKLKEKKKVAVFQTPTCDIFTKAICWWRICRIWWVGESWLSLVGVHGHSEISRDTGCKRSRWREGMDTSTRYVALERTWTRHVRAKGNGKCWLPGERWLRCSHHHGSVFSLLGSHLRLRSGADTVRCAGIRDNLWKA